MNIKHKSKQTSINWDDIKTIRVFSYVTQSLNHYLPLIIKLIHLILFIFSTTTPLITNNNLNLNLTSSRSKANWPPYSLRCEWKNFKSEICRKPNLRLKSLNCR